MLVYVHHFFTHLFHERLSFISNCEAASQCIKFINEMLASLSQKVQREAEEYGITMVTCCDGDLPRGQWATEKPLGSSPSGTCCCFLLNHLKNDQSHKVKEAITLLYYKERNGSLWALLQPFVHNLEKGFPMSGWKILAREKRFYKCQGVQEFIISLFTPILSSCSFVFHLFGKRGYDLGG